MKIEEGFDQLNEYMHRHFKSLERQITRLEDRAIFCKIFSGSDPEERQTLILELVAGYINDRKKWESDLSFYVQPEFANHLVEFLKYIVVAVPDIERL